MPDINVTITIPDALVARVSAATGASTKAEFEGWVRDRVKETVVSYETEQAIQAEDAKVEAAEADKQAAVEAAESTADTEIVLT